MVVGRRFTSSFNVILSAHATSKLFIIWICAHRATDGKPVSLSYSEISAESMGHYIMLIVPKPKTNVVSRNASMYAT